MRVYRSAERTCNVKPTKSPSGGKLGWTKMETQVAMYKAMRRLPRLMAEVSRLQKAVFNGSPKD